MPTEGQILVQVSGFRCEQDLWGQARESTQGEGSHHWPGRHRNEPTGPSEALPHTTETCHGQAVLKAPGKSFGQNFLLKNGRN